MMDEFIVVYKTNILPLRWLSNICGEIGGWSILRIAYLDEDKNYGFMYKVYGYIWKTTWPIYNKFGTYYKLDIDMNNKSWNDYDENGHPYWLYNEWQEDLETGDAWRLIRKEDRK